ncbi:MAG TPA: tRNA preQ1(34) S-adenosylmethionine ribosyltransferase-isomerase QueA [Thermoplasmatales archaeon]|nr:tRNA preQ1(34) S-adenosylmethionine ribosyltransferase-isomerase QueA [Thermoplasmatales archaeon]
MLDELDYVLPRERIAQRPCIPRDRCNLLVVHGDAIEHRKFYEIVDYLRKGDVLVLNDSRVMRVRLFGRKRTGGQLELLVIGGSDGRYECLMKGKYREGTVFSVGDYEGTVVEKHDGRCVVEIPLTFDEIERLGHMPTPPYIKEVVEHDEWYQTVFAREKGSIAAPTAGLHFIEELLQKIAHMGVATVFVTLHVGLATFMPIEKIQEESEYYRVGEEEAEIINNAEGRVIAVGTTTVKALESASKNGVVYPSRGWSNLFISHDHTFQSPMNGMLTNFHMPKSSPLVLTAAFAGKERLMRAYREALKRDYRMLSFGDAMLILPCSK